MLNPFAKSNRLTFSTRAGFTIIGAVVDDIGHAVVLRVEKGPRKSYVGKALVFPKNDMSGLKVEASR